MPAVVEKVLAVLTAFLFLAYIFLGVFVHRPFQRTITMQKDSTGHVGFIFKSGRITSLVKDGSAARNGLLTDHYICEINGQNIIGLKVTKHEKLMTATIL